MPFVYGLILLGVIIAGDSVSPIGQQPLWRQAAAQLFAPSAPATTTAVKTLPPKGASPMLQRQKEWQQQRENKQAAAEQHQRQVKRRKALKKNKFYQTVEGYRLMRKMKKKQAEMGHNFRMIRDHIQ